MTGRAWKPRRRKSELLTEALDGDFLVYDTRHHRAHCLPAESAAVFERCDGRHTIEKLSQSTGQSREEVTGIVRALLQADLLESDGLTRRELLLRGAVSAAAAVVTISVPRAASAASCINHMGNCRTGVCCGGLICVVVLGVPICITL